MAQKYDAQLVDNLAVPFPRRKEAAYAWGRAISCILGISPHLRFFVPFSSVDENFDAYDLSGQGRVMTQVSLTAASYGVYGALAPYVALDGVADYLIRLDEPGLEVVNGWTMTCWTYPTSLAGAMTIANKSITSENNTTLSLFIRGDVVGDPARARVGTGATFVDATSTNGCNGITNKWYFVAGSYIPGTSVNVWLDGIKTSNLVGVPAAGPNNAGNFQIGALFGPVLYFSGRIALPVLWGTPLSDTQVTAIYQSTYPLFYGV